MQLDLLEQSVGLDSLREALLHLRAGGTQFEDFVTRQLNDIDVWREELDRREHELNEQRRELLLDREGFDQQRGSWDDQRAAHALLHEQAQALTEQLQAELAEARQALAQQSEQELALPSGDFLALESRLHELESERDELLAAHLAPAAAEQEQLAAQAADFAAEKAALHREVDELRRQLSRLAGGAMELVDARAELAEARGESLRYKEMLQAAKSESNDGLQQQLRDVERERAGLEMELDAMRQRVAELAEHASQERHRSAEERAEWSGELKQLRRVLESQSRMLVDNQDQPARPTRETVGVASGEGRVTQTTSDPVLGSVMAQFEMLQKDLVRRRTNSTKPSPNRP